MLNENLSEDDLKSIQQESLKNFSTKELKIIIEDVQEQIKKEDYRIAEQKYTYEDAEIALKVLGDGTDDKYMQKYIKEREKYKQMVETKEGLTKWLKVLKEFYGTKNNSYSMA